MKSKEGNIFIKGARNDDSGTVIQAFLDDFV